MTCRPRWRSVSVRISSGDDLWAALWYGARLGADEDELEDPECVREIVADAIVNGGLEDAVNEAHAQIQRLTPGGAEHVWALELRDIARRAFAPVLPMSAPAPRRELGGVSA